MRTCGILMPVSSLPGPYGIGSLGAAAYRFVDFLKDSSQSYWQILPIGPTGYGDSPYQSFSAFSGNPYFIDLDLLKEQNLLTQEECDSARAPEGQSIDYRWLFDTRFALLRKAVGRMNRQDEDFKYFCADHVAWLEDYALFMALKTENLHVAWQDWPDELRLRDETALNQARMRLGEDIHFWRAVQYLFFKQWFALKTYANHNGIQIIGDIPIYVSPDSSEIWANSELFQVNEDKRQTLMAGCPPDAFSADGQLWGNPLYDWDYHAKTDFAWWVERLRASQHIYDITRIDHFRGFAGYFAIPAEDKTAVNGHWCKGPGKAFVDSIKRQLPDIHIIAEDLGYLTEDVLELMRYSGFPGMKVLQFAFDSREESDYLPHNYTANSVVYTGTHDNTTTADWEFSAPADDVLFAKAYLDITPDRNFTYGFIRAALGSVSTMAIIPLQDYLCLGKEARINIPSTLGGNWVWRAVDEYFTPSLSKTITSLAKMYGRI